MVWYNVVMVSKLKMTERLMSVRDKSKIFHSSGYARSQNRGSFGVTSGESFAERRTIDENRKFVRGYNNARVINDARAFDRVREYIPRTVAAQSGASAAGTAGATGATGASSHLAGAASHLAAPPARRTAPIRMR